MCVFSLVKKNNDYCKNHSLEILLVHRRPVGRFHAFFNISKVIIIIYNKSLAWVDKSKIMFEQMIGKYQIYA